MMISEMKEWLGSGCLGGFRVPEVVGEDGVDS